MGYYLGVHRYALVAAITSVLRWVPSRNRRLLNMHRYWNRLVNAENERLTRLVFDQDYELFNSNWCSKIKSIMISIDLFKC